MRMVTARRQGSNDGRTRGRQRQMTRSANPCLLSSSSESQKMLVPSERLRCRTTHSQPPNEQPFRRTPPTLRSPVPKRTRPPPFPPRDGPDRPARACPNAAGPGTGQGPCRRPSTCWNVSRQCDNPHGWVGTSWRSLFTSLHDEAPPHPQVTPTHTQYTQTAASPSCVAIFSLFSS
jgi:hypothetical protein